jgi:hypothetical protein
MKTLQVGQLLAETVSNKIYHGPNYLICCRKQAHFSGRLMDLKNDGDGL